MANSLLVDERQQIMGTQDFSAYIETREILTGYKVKTFFSMNTVKHLKKFPTGIVLSPSLEVFNTKLDKALTKMV